MMIFVITYLHNCLREFALDTTVILAQPRVPRLRAAVVYVDRRRPSRASSEIKVFQM